MLISLSYFVEFLLNFCHKKTTLIVVPRFLGMVIVDHCRKLSNFPYRDAEIEQSIILKVNNFVQSLNLGETTKHWTKTVFLNIGLPFNPCFWSKKCTGLVQLSLEWKKIKKTWVGTWHMGTREYEFLTSQWVWPKHQEPSWITIGFIPINGDVFKLNPDYTRLILR